MQGEGRCKQVRRSLGRKWGEKEKKGTEEGGELEEGELEEGELGAEDRKSTRLNSSHD